MQLNKSEWKVMNALWESHPATARDIHDALADDTEWAYTTVKTLLSRLTEKGVVRERKMGNTSVYQPVLSRNKARRSEVRALLDRAFDGAFAPLVNYIVQNEKLSRKDREALMDMIRAREKKERSK